MCVYAQAETGIPSNGARNRLACPHPFLQWRPGAGDLRKQQLGFEQSSLMVRTGLPPPLHGCTAAANRGPDVSLSKCCCAPLTATLMRLQAKTQGDRKGGEDVPPAAFYSERAATSHPAHTSSGHRPGTAKGRLPLASSAWPFPGGGTRKHRYVQCWQSRTVVGRLHTRTTQPSRRDYFK